MTEKVLDRRIGQDQSLPKDLVVRGRIRRDGAVHEHLVPTAKVDSQITDIVCAKLHLSRPRFDACLAENGSPIHKRSASFQTVFGGSDAPEHSGARTVPEDGVSLRETCWGREGVIWRSIPGWSDDGASHRMNCDTPPLIGNCPDTLVSQQIPMETPDFSKRSIHPDTT